MNSVMSPHHPKQYQRGAATLLVSLILLFSITLITIYAARNSVVETQIASNDYRAKQSFEAAQAGLEKVLGDLKNTGNRSFLDDNNGDGIIDSNGVAQSAVTLPDGGTYTVTYTNPYVGDTTLITVSVSATSNDGIGNRTVSRQAQIIPLTPNVPTSAVLAGGQVTGGGSALIHNDETLSTVVAGGSVTGPNSNNDPTNLNPCQGGGARGFTTGTEGEDGVTSQDPTTAGLAADPDAFFYDLFGMSKAEAKAMSQQMDCSSGCNVSKNDMDAYSGSIVWVTGDIQISGNGTAGSLSKPIVIIVDGDARMTGGGEINGLLYSTSISDAGTVDFHGAAVTETDLQSTGNYCFDYDSSVLNNILKNTGPIGVIAGSWRDF